MAIDVVHGPHFKRGNAGLGFIEKGWVAVQVLLRSYTRQTSSCLAETLMLQEPPRVHSRQRE